MAPTYSFALKFLGLALATALVVWVLQQYMYHRGSTFVEARIDNLTPLQEKQLSAFLEMNRLLTTLATTALGAIGFLLNSPRARSDPETLWLGLAGAFSVGVSIYFGYEAYEDILWMLAGQFFDLDNPQLHWVRWAHFYTFLLGAALFCAFAAKTFMRAHPQ